VPIASLQVIHVYSVLIKGWKGDNRKCVIFEVLMVFNMNITVFWDCDTVVFFRKAPLYQTTESPT